MKSAGCFCNNSFCRAICSLCFLLYSPSVYSETIILKSGKTVEGKISSRSEKSIEVDVGLGFPITYYMDDIQSIAPDNQPQSTASTAVSASKVDEADRLEQEGLELIDAGDMDKGIGLLRRSIEMDPKANRHLNLGTVLSGNGVSLFKSGKKSEAVKVLKQSKDELQKAIQMFDPDQESIFLSQAYYLLGEMHAQAFDDAKSAREYFQKSISFYDNPAADRGLKALAGE